MSAREESEWIACRFCGSYAYSATAFDGPEEAPNKRCPECTTVFGFDRPTARRRRGPLAAPASSSSKETDRDAFA